MILSLFKYTCWSFVCLLWRNVNSSPSSIKKFGFFIYFGYISDIWFIRYMICQHFILFCTLLFFLCWLFCLLWRGFLVLCSPTCLFLLCLPMFLVLYPRNHCQDQSYEFSSCSRSFMVSGPICKSLIHFKFKFGVWYNFHFLYWISSLHIIIIKETILFHVCIIGTIVEDHLIVHAWVYL